MAACASRVALEHTALPAFLFIRTTASAITFFAIATTLYGIHHFAEAFAPDFWLVMTAYAGLVTVMGGLAWYKAIKELTPAVVAGAQVLSPFLGILFAFALLGEIPSLAQWIGGGIIS